MPKSVRTRKPYKGPTEWHYTAVVRDSSPTEEAIGNRMRIICEALNLTQVSKIVTPYPVPGSKYLKAYTVCATLSQSHIAMTTYPEKDVAVITLCCCCPLDKEKVDGVLKSISMVPLSSDVHAW